MGDIALEQGDRGGCGWDAFGPSSEHANTGVGLGRWYSPGAGDDVCNMRFMGMHEGQLLVSVDVVRDLVGGQFPEYATLPIAPIHSKGTVNAIFPIGEGLAARFPLQPRAVDITRRWLQPTKRPASCSAAPASCARTSCHWGARGPAIHSHGPS